MPAAASSRDHHLAKQLVDALRALPPVRQIEQVKSRRKSEDDDKVLLRFSLGDKSMVLRVECRTSLYPRDAREFVSKSRRTSTTTRTADRPVVAAAAISPGARQILMESGVGYFVSGGSLCLPFPDAFVMVDKPDQPGAGVRASTGRFDLFTAGRTPVLHALLLDHDRWHTVSDLARRSGVTPGSVSKLMAHLEQEEWVQTQGSGPSKVRQLIKPAGLLDAWVAHERERFADRKVRRFFVEGRKREALLQLLPPPAPHQHREIAPYLVTGEAAAQEYAAYLTNWGTLTLRALPKFTAGLSSVGGLREVRDGANLQVIEVGQESALRFGQVRGELIYASPVQTYIDLMVSAGRAPDAAKHLREQVLSF